MPVSRMPLGASVSDSAGGAASRGRDSLVISAGPASSGAPKASSKRPRQALESGTRKGPPLS